MYERLKGHWVVLEQVSEGDLIWIPVLNESTGAADHPRGVRAFETADAARHWLLYERHPDYEVDSDMSVPCERHLIVHIHEDYEAGYLTRFREKMSR